MLVLDVNVLLAAHRADHPQHGVARQWLGELVAGSEQFGVPAWVWAGFLRLSTSRRVFVEPTPLADAFDFVNAVVAQPGHVAAEPGPRHLHLLRRVCEEADATGDLVPDAALVTIALELGAIVATFDRDFARFSAVANVRPGG